MADLQRKKAGTGRAPGGTRPGYANLADRTAGAGEIAAAGGRAYDPRPAGSGKALVCLPDFKSGLGADKVPG